MSDGNNIKIKIAIELILDEVKRLSEYDSNDIFKVVNNTLDNTVPTPEFATIIQNQYIMDIVLLEKGK